MKKKIIAVFFVLVTVMVFFSFNVFAADPVSQNYHYGERTVNGLLMSLSTREMYPTNDGTLTPSTSNVNVSSYAIVAVVRFLNTTDTNKYVTNAEVFIEFNSISPTVVSQVHLLSPVSFDNFSPDLLLTMNSYYNSWGFTITPMEDWSYESGFIVPAHDCLRAVAVIEMPAVYYNSGNTLAYATVSNVGVTSGTTVANTTAKPASLSTVISALDYGNYRLNAINQTVSSLDTRLQSISAAIDYSNYRVNIINDTLGNMYTYITDSQTGLPHITYDLDHIWEHVYNIENLLKGNSTTNNNITNDSSSLKTQSDNVHSQEQAYFTQNSQAIQSTGLGNYRIGTVEGNGIASVSSDFTALWNALGGWNSVYIFSLTLTMALTILRHAPNAISRRRRKDSQS